MCLAAALVAGTGSASELTIVENGRSAYVIAVSDSKSEAKNVKEAAVALRDFLKESTGCTLPLVKESDVADRPAFYLGRTKKGEAAGVPYGRLKEYVNCRKVVGRDIFLAGCDDSVGVKGGLQYHDKEYLGILEGINTHVTDLSYKRFYGTLKAVLGYLESENVVQFLMPGVNGRNVISHPALKVRDDLDWTGCSTFPFSNGRCYGDLYTTVALGQLDIPHYKHWGGHTFPVAVPNNVYGKTHPEYFILKDGVRRPDFGPADGGHLCVSNPDVQRLVVAEMKRQYDRGYRWIQLGPTDGQVPCECAVCKKLHADPVERQWLCYRAICEQAKAVMPDARIVVLSYGLSRFAPKSFDRMPDNVIVELCIWDHFKEKFEDWAKFRDVPKLAYVYFFGDFHAVAYAPTRTPRYLAETMRILKENNVMGIFKCGWADDIGLEGAIAYVYSKLLEDTGRDEMKLLDEFCERAYGAGAEPMKRFYRMMYSNMDTPRKHSVIDEFKSSPHYPENMFEVEFRPNTLNVMGRALTEAEAAQDPDPKVRARLALTRRSYEFLNIRMKSYFLEEAWQATREPAILDIAEKVFDAREAMLDSWYDEKGKMKKLDGFDWAYMHNASKKAVVRGGGLLCPCFPELFRYGPGNVKELKKAVAR